MSQQKTDHTFTSGWSTFILLSLGLVAFITITSLLIYSLLTASDRRIDRVTLLLNQELAQAFDLFEFIEYEAAAYDCDKVKFSERCSIESFYSQDYRSEQPSELAMQYFTNTPEVNEVLIANGWTPDEGNMVTPYDQQDDSPFVSLIYRKTLEDSACQITYSADFRKLNPDSPPHIANGSVSIFARCSV